VGVFLINDRHFRDGIGVFLINDRHFRDGIGIFLINDRHLQLFLKHLIVNWTTPTTIPETPTCKLDYSHNYS
jgi:hypothetical protein